MVCQAATQTRFRALKYEYGIAGSSTIIVRVIACFQPLQDCQAEYFRHLLKPVTFPSVRSLRGLLMKQHPDPWANLPPSMWPFSSNSTSALQKHDRGQQNTPRMVLPTYTNPYCTFPVLGARKFTRPMTWLNRPANLNFGATGFARYQDRAVGFSQSREQTSLIFSSSLNPSLTFNPTNQSRDFQGSNEAASMNHGGEEMHEDTEEINALLYSDSEDEYGEEEEEEEEASTGHSPMVPTAGASSEAAVSSVFPVKRKRVDMDDDEPDASLLLDTASSSFGSHWRDTDADTESNTRSPGEASQARSSYRDCKRIKRERILEIINVLRRIIPRGKGKDAATVLDEAISYLKCLKLKAMALASTTIN